MSTITCDVQLTGGGGTDMRVGITAATRARPAPHVIVVLTDGDTPWPDEPTRARLVCAVISPPPPPPTPSATAGPPRRPRPPGTWASDRRMVRPRPAPLRGHDRTGRCPARRRPGRPHQPPGSRARPPGQAGRDRHRRHPRQRRT